MSDGTVKNVEIFSVGKWRGSRTVEATPAMLDQIVSNFSTINQVSGYGVPVKLGHNNRVGEPAFGWMTSLSRNGDVLEADFADVPPEIVDAIAKRRYNSVSIELYPMVSHAGDTFENVLGGVALLGAEWPAVKGLKPLSASVFSGAGEKLELSKEIADVTTFTEDQHNTLLSAAINAAKEETKTEFAAQVAALTASVAELTARAEKAEKSVSEFADASEKAEIAAIITAAEAKGQIVPANKAKVVAFAESVRTAASGDARKAMIATFKEFVETMPAKAVFGEQGASKPAGEAAEGQKVSDEVHAAVTAYMSDKGEKSYEKAMNAVFAANPDLKTRYAQEM